MFVINKHAKNEEKGQGRFRDALIERNAIFQFVAARRRNLTWCWEEMETQMEVGGGGALYCGRRTWKHRVSIKADRKHEKFVKGELRKETLNLEEWREVL